MADELDPTEGLPGSEVAPGEEETQTEVIENVEQADPPDPIEALASKMGWAPKDQFRGNADDWKPADEFIIAGKDIQRNLSRELREVRSTVDNISRTSAALFEQQLAEKRAELETQFNAAVDEGDHQAARHVTTKIAQLEARAPVAPADPATDAFIQKHAGWFNKDAEATSYAVARADHYAKQGLAPARQLAAVEQDMRGVFPDLFAAPAKPAPRVAQPASRTAATSSRKKGFHDLPAEAQAVAKDMHDRLGIPLETYVTNYFAERKVG